MITISVIGAGGFVGERLVEASTLGGTFRTRPFLRSHRGLARLSRLGVEVGYADTADREMLVSCIAGSDAVVNLTMGTHNEIVRDVENLVWACERAKVPRLVHLSTAEVFGRVEDEGIDDDSPPLKKHWMEYAREKGKAELVLRERMHGGGCRIVVLRPGLIWGPRSPWVIGPATEILSGAVRLFGGGCGVCNLVFLDNLVAAIGTVSRRECTASGFFNVGDQPEMTWAGYYRRLAGEMGIGELRIESIPDGGFRETIRSRTGALVHLPILRGLKQSLRPQQKVRIRRWLSRLGGAGRRSVVAGPVTPPEPTKAAWWVQTTRRRLPTGKFEREIGLDDWVSFEESMRRTGEWLRDAGFSKDATGAVG